MPRQPSGAVSDANDPCATCGHLRHAHVSTALAVDGRVCTGLRLRGGPMGTGTPCVCTWFVMGKAKPKKAKETVSMRLTWNGPAPEIGDFLMSTYRPTYGYQIVSVDPNAAGTVLEIETKRIPAKTVPKDAKVHPLRWSSRDPAQHKSSGWG